MKTNCDCTMGQFLFENNLANLAIVSNLTHLKHCETYSGRIGMLNVSTKGILFLYAIKVAGLIGILVTNWSNYDTGKMIMFTFNCMSIKMRNCGEKLLFVKCVWLSEPYEFVLMLLICWNSSDKFNKVS